MKRITEASWSDRWTLLTAILAAGDIFIGLTSPLPGIRWPTLAGGLMVLAALWLATRSRPAALALLATGAVLPVATGWWSVVVPVTGILILLCGTQAIRTTTRTSPIPPSSQPSRPHAQEG